MFSRGTFPGLVLAAGLTLLAVFGVLVVWHARVDERVDWHDALHAVNQFALARIGRAWDLLPPAGEPPAAIEHHPYALDLDLFGRASLLQWLGPAATIGRRRHAAGLAAASGVARRRRGTAGGRGRARRRRSNGASTSPRTAGWSAGVRRAELEAFLRWAESPGPFTPPATAALASGRRV